MMEAAPRADALDQGLERAAEQVFLSPRVVDQRSFDELTGTLQRIVREAAAQGKSLTTTGEQVRTVTDQLRALMRELQQRTDAASKVLPLLEAQGKRVQELTTRVTHEAALTKAREVRDAFLKAVDEERAKIVQAAKDQVTAEVREAVRGVVREEVERARAGVAESLEAQAAGIERRTEAAATEVAEQLSALRADVARIVAEGKTALSESPPAVPARAASPDTSAAEQRIHAVATAARAAITATADEALSRVGAQLTELRATGNDHTASLAELRTLVSRAETLLCDLSERVEASAHAADHINAALPAEATHATESPLVAPMTAGLTGDLQQATLHAQQAGAWLMQILTAADHVGRGLDALVRTAQSAQLRPQGR